MESNKFYAAILVLVFCDDFDHCVRNAGRAGTARQACLPDRGAAEASAGAPAAKPAETEPVSPLLAKADVDHGAQIARQCMACHNFAKGGPNMLGPTCGELLVARTIIRRLFLLRCHEELCGQLGL